MAMPKDTTTFLYFGMQFYFQKSKKKPEMDLLQIDRSYGMNFNLFTRFDAKKFSSQIDPYYGQYGDSNVYYCIYDKKINFSDASLSFFEEHATISVESDLSSCEEGIMHHSSFVAAYRTNQEIYQRDYESLAHCQKDLLQSVLNGTIRKRDAKEFTWENEPNEDLISFETTWRRRLFHVLSNIYDCVIDTSEQHHTNANKFLQDLLPGIKNKRRPFIFSGVPDILCNKKLICTLSKTGDLERDIIELKRTEESNSRLPNKIAELFAQMYVMICSQIIKSAVENGNLEQTFRTNGIFYERFRLYFVTMTIKHNENIQINVLRSIDSAHSSDYCYYFSKLAI